MKLVKGKKIFLNKINRHIITLRSFIASIYVTILPKMSLTLNTKKKYKFMQSKLCAKAFVKWLNETFLLEFI